MKTASDPILVFIERYVQEHGYPPTFREIATGCYFSLSSVAHQIYKLAYQGQLTYEPSKGQSIQLTQESRS